MDLTMMNLMTNLQLRVYFNSDMDLIKALPKYSHTLLSFYLFQSKI